MKVLFFNPDQYVGFENEPSNFELRLPIINCGIVNEYIDFSYQKVLWNHGKDVMNDLALKETFEYKPDLLVYSTTWRDENVDTYVFQEIMKKGIPIYINIWDTFVQPDPYEIMWLFNCNYLGIADSITRSLYLSSVAKELSLDVKVLYVSGNNVYTDLIKKKDMEKVYDVILLGSKEEQRVEFVNYLEKELPKYNIQFNKLGGLVDTSTNGGRKLTDKWIPMDEYVDIINRAKICICSPTGVARYHLKGKIFHYMACGSLCFSESNSEVRKIIPDECIVYFDNFEDCVKKIRYYMRNEEERNEIAQRGYKWFCDTFNYKEFWSNFLSTLKQK